MPKIKKRYSNSKTPWDLETNLSSTEKTVMFSKQDIYNFVHSPLKNSGENYIINKEIVDTCPYCNSKQIIKHGFTSNNVQRYKCKGCKKTFTSTTNTILENHKVSLTSRIKFMLDIFTQSSTLTCSQTSCISYKTAQLWLKDIINTLKGVQDNEILEGDNVQIDEIYIPFVRKNLRKVNGKIYGSRKTYNYCIGLGVDDTKVIAIFEGDGHTTRNKTWKTFGNKIKKGSTILHDSEPCHSILVNKLSLFDETYKWSQLYNLNSKDNPMIKLIRVKQMLLNFLEKHKDFNLKEIQGYLDLFCFIMNKPNNYLEKIVILLNKMMNASNNNDNSEVLQEK